MFEFEKQLDELLNYFAENKRVYIENVPEHLKNDIQVLIKVLANYGYIEPAIIGFFGAKVLSDKEFIITPSGMAFSRCKGSFIRQAKYDIKLHKKIDLEIFKIRWDIILSIIVIFISVLSLVISIIAFKYAYRNSNSSETYSNTYNLEKFCPYPPLR